MTLARVALLKARLQGIRSTLERTPPKEKSGQAAISVTEEFNNIVAAIAQQYPALAESLPRKISSAGVFSRVGKTNVTYLDLEILAEQVLNLLALVE